jgi:hypothetical protein
MPGSGYGKLTCGGIACGRIGGYGIGAGNKLGPPLKFIIGGSKLPAGGR